MRLHLPCCMLLRPHTLRLLEDVDAVRSLHRQPRKVSSPRLHQRFRWKALLSGRVTDDHYLERATLHIAGILANKENIDDLALGISTELGDVLDHLSIQIEQVTIADEQLIRSSQRSPNIRSFRQCRCCAIKTGEPVQAQNYPPKINFTATLQKKKISGKPL